MARPWRLTRLIYRLGLRPGPHNLFYSPSLAARAEGQQMVNAFAEGMKKAQAVRLPLRPENIPQTIPLDRALLARPADTEGTQSMDENEKDLALYTSSSEKVNVLERFDKEELGPTYGGDYEKDILDDGTMPNSRDSLAEAVVGHRIVKAERRDVRDKSYSWASEEPALVLTLDTGKEVVLREEGDCCAFTSVESFLLNPEGIEHVITGVGTTEGFCRWHIYAAGLPQDVLTATVGWSCGNPFYYGYGFSIEVRDAEPEVITLTEVREEAPAASAVTENTQNVLLPSVIFEQASDGRAPFFGGRDEDGI